MTLFRIGRSSIRSTTASTTESFSASGISRGRRWYAEKRSASCTVSVGTWMSVWRQEEGESQDRAKMHGQVGARMREEGREKGGRMERGRG
eukprot:2145874-Rhodomonas_salina.1